MECTLAIICSLLARNHTLVPKGSAHPGLFLHYPRLYRGRTPEPGCLYVMDELSDLRSAAGCQGCGALICAPAPEHLPESLSGWDTAFVTDGSGKLDILEEVTAAFWEISRWEASLSAPAPGTRPEVLLARISGMLPGALLLRQEDRVFRFPRDCALEIPEDLPGDCPSGMLPDGTCYRKFSRESAIFLWKNSNPFLTQSAMPLFLRSAEALQAACFSDSAASDGSRLHRILEDLVLENKPLSRDRKSLLARLGWPESGRFQVAVLRFLQPPQPGISRRLEQDFPGSCCLSGAGELIWLLNSGFSPEPQRIRGYLALFSQEHSLQAGLSNPLSGPDALPEGFLQAREVLELGRRRHPEQWIFDFRDDVSGYLMRRFAREFSVEQVLHPGVGFLADYDRSHATDLAGTLRLYLDSRFSASLAAETLGIHRSTFLRRLKRALELSGIRLEDPEEIFHVMFSLRLLSEQN